MAESSNSLHSLLVVEQLLTPERVDGQLILDFVVLFSRAEFALKKAGFARPYNRNGIVVLWDEFADKVESRFSSTASEQVKHDAEYLLLHPPQKQVMRTNNRFEWCRRERPHGESNMRFIIRGVTTVRNNLFHGGKELHGPLVERDTQLLKSSLSVLAHALALNEEVLAYFSRLPPEPAVA